MTWRQQSPQSLEQEVAGAATCPSPPCSDSTPLSAQQTRDSTGPLLLLVPNAGLGPRAGLTRGQQDALRDGCCRASWAKSHPALWMPGNDEQDNTQAMAWLVPPLQPTHGAGGEPAQWSPGHVGKGRALYLELCRGIQGSSA